MGESGSKKIAGDGPRRSIQAVIGVLIILSLAVTVVINVPTDAAGQPDLPSVALGQESLYRIEIFLLVFYGGLLVATPAYRGLIGGRLPTEISARGAKFAEEAAGSIEETRKLVEELRERVTSGEAKATRARLNIDQLAEEAKVRLRD